VERESAGRSLHWLIGEAVARAARLQEQSRAALEEVHASSAALERTVAALHRARAERQRFGNRQFDAEEGRGPG
jgi:hypothetical protein